MPRFALPAPTLSALALPALALTLTGCGHRSWVTRSEKLGEPEDRWQVVADQEPTCEVGEIGGTAERLEVTSTWQRRWAGVRVQPYSKVEQRVYRDDSGAGALLYGGLFTGAALLPLAWEPFDDELDFSGMRGLFWGTAAVSGVVALIGGISYARDGHVSGTRDLGIEDRPIRQLGEQRPTESLAVALTDDLGHALAQGRTGSDGRVSLSVAASDLRMPAGSLVLRAEGWPEAECEVPLAKAPAASTALADHVASLLATGDREGARTAIDQVRLADEAAAWAAWCDASADDLRRQARAADPTELSRMLRGIPTDACGAALGGVVRTVTERVDGHIGALDLGRATALLDALPRALYDDRTDRQRDRIEAARPRSWGPRQARAMQVCRTYASEVRRRRALVRRLAQAGQIEAAEQATSDFQAWLGEQESAADGIGGALTEIRALMEEMEHHERETGQDLTRRRIELASTAQATCDP